MPETISSLFQIRSRYMRSAHLERDFSDLKALGGYVLTPQAQDSLKHLAGGLSSESGRRAWRITGDYGTGKSSLALVMAHLFSNRNEGLPVNLRHAVDFKGIGIQRPQLLPVLVTGSREQLSKAILRSLYQALAKASARGRKPALLDEIGAAIEGTSGAEFTDASVINFLNKASDYITASGKGSGLLLILDELGKLLEYAALNPHRQDVFLLQSLAECAARSGSRPLFVVGLLHQGISAYADQLSESAQREWEKVAGRFEELIFSQPLEQTAILVADALRVRVERLPKPIISHARAAMGAVLDLKWYGATYTRKSLVDNAIGIYPLHPTVLPVLVKLFSRFGQNERSLFSFLLSTEPFGLQEFSKQVATAKRFYRIHDLYDYIRTAFGHRLSTLSYRSKWNQIDSIVASFSDELDLRVLKTVGLLNLLDTNEMLASDEAILLAVASNDSEDKELVRASIEKLRGKRALYFRGRSGGYCLWPFTSVNLERAYEDATRAVGKAERRTSSLVTPYLENRPLVARRHYIETGNLRHFDVRFTTVRELPHNLKFDPNVTDGLILVTLCDTEEERLQALSFALSEELRDRPEVLIAVPQPLNALTQLVQEVQKWEWVRTNTPELNGDKYAAEEVSRQIAASRQNLEKRVHDFIGLQQFTGGTDLQWFHQNHRLEVRNGRDLLGLLSKVCDQVYPGAPHVRNELINRRNLSSSAAAARVRLLERLFSHHAEPALGMNPDKKPPEMSIYLSLLKEGGIHKAKSGKYVLQVPRQEDDICHVQPSLNRILEFLEQRADSKVKVSEVLAELRRPPYGVRDGLSTILLAIFAVINEQHTAFYKNGAFLREMAGLNIMHLVKVPDAYEIQYCKVAGVRANLFEKLLKVLELSPSQKDKADILDVVRPLCTFAAQLPSYTQKTSRLSPCATAVRSALMGAREPSTLLFSHLPTACGFEPFLARKDKKSKEVNLFVETLKNALDELKTAYPQLQERLWKSLATAYELSGKIQSVRAALTHRAESILIAVKEPRLKAFCLRLVDRGLSDQAWLESLASFICSMPPARWTDTEEDKHSQELEVLCGRFRRVESIAFRHRKDAENEYGIRVSITQLDGTELDSVIYVQKSDEVALAEIEAQISAILHRTKHIGLAATAQAFWNALSSRESKAKGAGGDQSSANVVQI